MTDRYANGDPSNDLGGATGGQGPHRLRPDEHGVLPRRRPEGTDRRLHDPKQGLARIKSLGFTAVWITPPFGQQTVQGDSAAYHGYWILHFDQIDPHFGTAQDFGDFVSCAHRLGLKVYLDIVVNHTADVVQLTGNAGFLDPARCPIATATARSSSRPGTRPEDLPVPERCEHAVCAVLLGALRPDGEVARVAERPDEIPRPRRHRLQLVQPDCYEQGDFFGLDDLFTEQPVVMNGLAQIYSDWITKYKVDGFRVDTAKHVNAAFFGLWVPKILAAARGVGIDDFPIFGEVTLTDDIALSAFVRDRGLPNVLDFPFQDAAPGFAAGQTGARALSTRLADDDYFRLPNGAAPTPPRSSATTTWVEPRCRSSSTARRRTRGCCRASSSATTSSICFAARRSSTTATRSG